MAKMARTWWGQKFLDVLSISMNIGRLKRGRSYAGPSRILEFEISGDTVTAKIRGNINPYFEVYKEPRYKVTVKLKRFSASDWNMIIDQISRNAAFLSQLLMDEMPSTIEDVFVQRGLYLLPRERADLISKCSCPDYASPCKHVAGVYYKIASLLDRDPLLLFQLRGMKFETLHEKLAATPLGKTLVDQQADSEIEVEYHACRYTSPSTETRKEPDIKTFWQGDCAVPQVASTGDAVTPAILIKRGGEFPAFWQSDKSFVEVMEVVYSRVVTKNKTAL